MIGAEPIDLNFTTTRKLACIPMNHGVEQEADLLMDLSVCNAPMQLEH
jgi:hypothetical protein